MGTEEKPLVFRSYFPNPDLEPEVLKRHGQGNPTPRYSAKTGLLSDERMDQAIPGIPAAIGVNAGKTLSYVWDTTECRLLYAWVNGFLDMEAYWGEPTRGSRKSNDYVPRLYGQLFYKATGANPLRVNGENLPEDLKYLYHSRKSTHPEFTYQAGADRTISTMVTPGESAQTAIVSFRSSNAADKLSYEAPNTAFEILENNSGSLKVLLRPNAAETFTGFKKQEVKITEANAKAGEKLYQMFGCAACHTTDGSRNHGPTFQGLSGSVRKFGDDEITADSDYLRESIREPNAKHVPEYPVGMMPAYPLSEVQIDSLVLYIQTLK
ncbi:MAG: cytochrome c [Verrucomicrobiales bacterium]|nr:cytochrome c [Verrucomicrobiales bacterium]